MSDSQKTYAVDFETYYDDNESIKVFGATRYLKQGGESYLVSVVGPNIKYCGPVERAPWEEIAGEIWISHNNGFDQQVFLRDVEAGKIPKGVAPSDWYCSANLAAYCGYPRALDKATEQLTGVKPSKDVRKEMKGVRWADASLDLKRRAIEYARDDAIHCLHLWDELESEWPQVERDIANLTNYWGWDGVHIDLDHVAGGIHIMATAHDLALERLPWVSDGYKPQSKKGLAKACEAANIPCPKSTAIDSAECAKWEARYGDKFPFVGAMRDLRRANKHLRSLEALLRRTSTDGVMSYSMLYFGAHTGRWSGSGGFNMQNPPIKEHIRNEIGYDFRKCFVPAAGKKFIVCDLAQIEPRVIYWFMQDEEMLDAMRQGMSIYEAYARKYLKYTHPDPLKKHDKAMYDSVKAEVLGLGYGMGAERYQGEAAKYGVSLTLGQAETAVLNYREINYKIKQTWDLLARELRDAVSKGEDYEIPLPSGRSCKYFDPRWTRDRGLLAKVQRGGHHRKFFGGMLFENAIQATARDIFAQNCLINLHTQRPGRIVWHMHDEVILECDMDVDPRDVEQVMSKDCPWMPGLPILSEAMECTEFYGKD